MAGTEVSFTVSERVSAGDARRSRLGARVGTGRRLSRLTSFFATPQIRSNPKDAKFLLETLSSEQITWQILNLVGAIVFSLAYTLTLSLVARRDAAAVPALNLIDRVVVFGFCALQLTFSVLYLVRLYRYGWVRCTMEMRSCFLQGIFMFITMNLVGNVARTVSETSSTTIAILYVSSLIWQWFWIFGFYWHAMAILRLYRNIKDRWSFLQRNRMVLSMCFLIAALQTAFCSWSRTALGLTWPSMLAQYIERQQYRDIAYSITFGLVVALRLFLDGWIAFELYLTFRVLLDLPYTCCHHKQMAARFFRVITAISYIFLVANDTLSGSLVPLPTEDASIGGVRIHLLGVARFNGGTLAMLFIWSILLLYTHLPPTVSGIWSPWIAALVPDPAAYQRKRAEAARLRSRREHSSLSTSPGGPWTRAQVDDEQELPKTNLYYKTEAEAISSGDHWLSRSLVLETHILLFNLAYLSYRPWRDPQKYAEIFDRYGVGEKYPLQARVVRRVSSSIMDVHVLIIELADRIVVSFRGTKSTRNLRTDINFRRVRLDAHLHAQECPNVADAWRRSVCSKHGCAESSQGTEAGRSTTPNHTATRDTSENGVESCSCSSSAAREAHKAGRRAAENSAKSVDHDLEQGAGAAESARPLGRSYGWWWRLRTMSPWRFGGIRAQAGEDFSWLFGRRVPMKVHDGFAHAYLSVREELVDALVPLIAKPVLLPFVDELEEPNLSGTWSDAYGNDAQDGRQWSQYALEHASPSERRSDASGDPFETEQSTWRSLRRSASGSSDHEGRASTASNLPLRAHKPVIFCGHSLGAALATIAALDLTTFQNSQSLHLSSDRVMCVTFGSPRVGNRSFSRTFRRMVPFSFRWAAVGDIVTKVPFWGYEHVRVKVMIDPLTGSILMDPSIMEEFVVAFRNSVDAHLRNAYTQGLQKWCSRYHPGWEVHFWDFHDVSDEHAMGATLESVM